MLSINLNFALHNADKNKLNSYIDKGKKSLEKLLAGTGPGNDFLGWLDYDKYLPVQLIQDIKKSADRLIKISDYIVVIGIGGSYLGAKAIIESLPGNGKVLFAGFNLSPHETGRIIKKLENRDISLVVVSKSGATTETSVSFRLLKDLILEKYPNNAYERIVCVTDEKKGALVQFCEKYGSTKFIIPDDIGGRFSVFTPVGLLPIACEGHDINIIRKSILSSLKRFKEISGENPAILYAAFRNYYYHLGKKVEYLIAYDESLRFFIEWWKQLYGESEGKDGVGIMPSGAIFTTDLHSLGQYLQQGERLLQETIIKIGKYSEEFFIPEDSDNFDNFNKIANKPLSMVQDIAFYATSLAHFEGDVPLMILNLEDLSLSSITETMIFFMFACGISGYLLGINPFDQPGVEDYKRNMKALMGHPQFQKEKIKLEEQIKIFF